MFRYMIALKNSAVAAFNAYREFSKTLDTLGKLIPRKNTCYHELDLNDLKATGIPEPEQPDSLDGHERWKVYYSLLNSQGAWFVKRVEWRCVRCGEVLYGNCGLDILARDDVRGL